MNCTNCGTEIAQEDRFCPACGKKQFQQSEAKPIGVLLRGIAAFIDFCILMACGYIIAVIFKQTTADGFNLTGSSAFLWWGIGFAYYVLFEGTTGATPGKMALGLKVIKATGAACNMRCAIIRTVCRIIDHFFLIGAIVILFTKLKQRIGDKAAGTIVVKSRDMQLSSSNARIYFDD
ncbi:MAG: RDD family protein [Negativicutes bacterium]|nr:RDD family protein [Negativicutes bacterium]